MKAYYSLPDGTYSLILSMDDLQHLLTDGRLLFQPAKVPCKTSRVIFNSEESDFEELDEKEIDNLPLLHVDTNVADIEAGKHYIQFMRITVENYEPEAI